jgi:hypothetical protein
MIALAIMTDHHAVIAEPQSDGDNLGPTPCGLSDDAGRLEHARHAQLLRRPTTTDRTVPAYNRPNPETCCDQRREGRLWRTD